MPRQSTVLAILMLLLGMRLAAQVNDVRDVIARESARYRAQHFPSGEMPPKHDWRGDWPLRHAEQGIATAPGGIGYGLWYDSNAFLWTNYTIVDFYPIAPSSLGQTVSYLYLTSTCRAKLGTESLIAYEGASGPQFWIYDWAQPAADRWQVMMDLPTENPQYLTTSPDEFAISRQMAHIRNGTYYKGFTNGMYQWENEVMLFNFNSGNWDLIYSYNYATAALTNNLYANDSYNGSWGPIIETFNSYTNINPVGFDFIHLFQDGNSSPLWLAPSNCYVSKNETESGVSTSTNWQLLAVAPYSAFAAAISSNKLVSSQQTNFGCVYVTANTNAVSFSNSPNSGVVSSGWVPDPVSNQWDTTVVGLIPRSYVMNFNPVSGLIAPGQQAFTILTNSVTVVAVVYTTVPTIHIGSVGVLSGQYGFTITGTTNIPIEVDVCTNLANGSWTLLKSCTLTNGSIYFSDPAWTNYPERFYRVSSP